jgi:hypothetical protein
MRNVVKLNIIILGSGAADGVPAVACLIKQRKGCQACRAAAQDPRNKRGQTSTVVQVFYDDTEQPQ